MEIQQYIPFIIAGVLIIGGIFILRIGLAITRAQSKTNIKWVAGSYLIQYGITLFVSSPMLLDMLLTELDCTKNGICDYYGGPNPAFIAMAVIFSTLLVLNLINVIHKPGLTRSFILTLLILGPIIGANYLIFRNIGNVL